MLLEDKVIVISGVGPGMGQSLARIAAREGAKVAIGARNQAFLDRVADDIIADGGAVVARSTDVTDAGQCAALAQAALDAFGRIDGLVNSAYIHGNWTTVDQADPADWLKVIASDTSIALNRVAVSHAYTLGEVEPDAFARAADGLAAAGVAIMTNAPGSHAFPPVAALRAAGVTVFGGSDNIRDSWWPYGDGDMLNRANMIGYRSGFYEDRELEDAFDVVTHAGARALGLEGYGLVPGARADFVALKAAHVPEAVVAVPRERAVYRAGRLVARDGKLLGR